MGFDLDVSIPVLTVLIQGVLSFFSPCVLPIIPLYVGYLSGGTMTVDEQGIQRYDQRKILLNTFFFILGVSFAFFLLGLGVSALGQFFTQYQMVFARVGGIVVVLLGLMQLGIFEKPFGGREWRLPLRLNVLRMSPVTALLMGFTFSFAWTPCVGPALSTVLIMISSAATTMQGIGLMGVYTLGFTLPFLLVGIFTTKTLSLFKKYSNLVQYAVKAGAILMILMGAMMFTGTMNGVTGYLSTLGTETSAESGAESVEKEPAVETETEKQETSEPSTEEKTQEERPVIAAPDFTLEDQNGTQHTLSEYKGQVVFLNFWATWCPPCKAEMPDIEKLYQDYGYNEEDVVILGVALPNNENPYSQDGSLEDITQFLADNEYTYPTAMDMTGEIFMNYGISSFPTTFMIDVEGNVYGYVAGSLTYEIMENIIQQTQDGVG